MFLKQPIIRKFEYTPRFFNPDADEEANNSQRIKFRRLTERKPVPRRSFWAMLIMIVLLILFIRYFSSVVRSEKQEFKFEDLKIETIE